MKYGKNGFKYRPQYALNIICADEEEQKKLYEELKLMGLKVKVVCV